MASYGYRRVTAQLHAEGILANHKKVMRLMREHGLSVRPRRRFVATTDSDHDGPIFPNLAKDIVPAGPNQLWVADITYIAITTGFVYLAAILDAWSRRVVGYAIGRRVDARLALAALRAASRAAGRPRAASTIPIGARNMLPRATAPNSDAWPQGFHGTARQPLRQRQGRELHEDAQGRGGLPDGLRKLRRRGGLIAALHRRGLQQQAAPFRARLSEPRKFEEEHARQMVKSAA